MAGHSKWSNIKHRKSKQDAEKGKLFTKLAREIIIAAKEGGGDPEGNFKLRIAIDKAKANNLPNDNITRAIQKGVGGGDEDNYESIIYEGYGPAGVAVLLDITTDNRNRTAGDIRHLFSKNGGNMGETGCVSWMFERKGYLTLKREEFSGDDDELFLIGLESGAEDIKIEDDLVEVYTSSADFMEVKKSMEAAGLQFLEAELSMIPQNTIYIEDTEQAKKILKLVEALEDHDDVQNVYANFDFPDEIMENL